MALTLCGGFLLLKPSKSDDAKALITSLGVSSETSSEVAKSEEPRPSQREVKSSSNTEGESASKKELNKRDARKKLAKEQQAMVAKMFKDKMEAKTARKLSELEEKLQLNPEQVKALKAYYNKNSEILGDIYGMQNIPDQGSREQAAAVLEEDLESYMADHLSPEQQNELAEHRREQIENEIDILTLKELSGIIGVTGISDDQRQKIYEILSEDIATEHSERSDTAVVTNHAFEAMGVGGDLFSSTLKYAADMEGLKGEEADTEGIMERIKNKEKASIDQKVERLSEVLNTKQVDSYRSDLEEKSATMLGLVNMAVSSFVGDTE